MDLILLRHGKAEDTNPEGDFARALTEKGREQSRRAGTLLKSAGTLPDIVLTSPLIRARQTADEFCQAAGIAGPVIQDWLASGFPPATGLNELVTYCEFERVAIIGHEPDFSLLITLLIGASKGSINMKKGALACVRVFPPACQGRLLFLIPPKLGDDRDE